MSITDLAEVAQTYLQRLCLDIPSRRVGSKGNRIATDFFAEKVASFGFQTEMPMFDCIDWRDEGVHLSIGDVHFQAFASPYSLGCSVAAPLAAATTLEELEDTDVSHKIVLLHGRIAKQQLMPKNFPFYNPDEHKQIIQLLETKEPLAIIAATSRDVEMVGSMYPFPLIEDGDFDIPSVYMTDEEGKRLAKYAGSEIWLESRAQRIPAKGCNVIARKGANPNHRVVLFAHIDAKMGTPGASDNASGVVTLLLLAELLAGYSGNLDIEIVAMNGEDYYSNPGEQQYLALNAGRFDEIVLGINVDGVGYYKGNTAYSLYDCPSEIADLVHEVVSAHKGIVEGEAWYQGDHGLFLLNHTPALAFTAELLAELMREVTHTPEDTPEILDTVKLGNLANSLHALLLRLDQLLA